MPKITSIQYLERQLAQKQKQLKALNGRRSTLAVELAQVDRQIAALLGEAPKPSKKAKTAKRAKKAKVAKKARKRRGMTLPAHIEQILGKVKGPMSPKDVAAAVKKAGYKSRSKDFYNVVMATLSGNKRFKRVKPGFYATAK